MDGFERIYPRKPRKPRESEDTAAHKRSKRAHKRIAKYRHMEAVYKWKEHTEIRLIRGNADQPALTDYLPRVDEKPEKDKGECDP